MYAIRSYYVAFQLTVILLAAGTVFGIIKGAEYETAMFSIAIILS